jgi:hypothetical protein
MASPSLLTCLLCCCTHAAAPQPSGRFVGRLSADALDELLRECPPHATLALHADGSASEHGPAVDAFRAAVARGASTIIASEDAAPPETRLGTDAAHALHAAEQRMRAAMEHSEMQEHVIQERIMIAQHQAACEMDAAEDECGTEHFGAFLALRARTEAARHDAAERAAALAEQEAEKAAAKAADDALAAAADAGHFDDAEEEEEDAEAHTFGVNAATFSSAAAGDAVALAALEEAACAKRRAIDLPALQARIRARISSAHPIVRSCLRDVFDGFGEEGTEEEGAVRTLLVANALQTRAALARRAAEQAGAGAGAEADEEE